MTPFPIGPTLKILEGGFKGVRFVFRRKRERKETDRLVFEALVAAVCPGGAEPMRNEELAHAIAERLAETDFPKEAHTDWREKPLPPSLRRALPGAGDVEGDPFSARLQGWVATALEAPELRGRLENFACDGHRVDPEAIVIRFREFFPLLLIRNPSRFRTALAKEIQEADSFRKWGAEVERRAEAAIAATALTGVGATAAAEALGWADPIGVGAISAVATGLLGAVFVGGVRKSRPSPLRELAREQALAWVADLIRRRDGASGVSVDALRVEIAELPLDAEQGPCVSDGMLEDLRTRLVPLAREADDEALAAALRGVEAAAVRRERGRSAALPRALVALLDATEGLA